MNKKLVAALGSVGQSAMGLCGGDGHAFRARKKMTNGHDLGFVGEISLGRSTLDRDDLAAGLHSGDLKRCSGQ